MHLAPVSPFCAQAFNSAQQRTNIPQGICVPDTGVTMKREQQYITQDTASPECYTLLEEPLNF